MNEIEYKTYSGKIYKIPDNDYNRGAVSAIMHIGKKEGWEESQDKYFKEIYEDFI